LVLSPEPLVQLLFSKLLWYNELQPEAIHMSPKKGKKYQNTHSLEVFWKVICILKKIMGFGHRISCVIYDTLSAFVIFGFFERLYERGKNAAVELGERHLNNGFAMDSKTCWERMNGIGFSEKGKTNKAAWPQPDRLKPSP
jgi:hypothetical protein